MFDIGASEFLLVVIVAIVVIGPKDLPMALRAAGRWIAKIRSISGHFRSGVETMIREAELEEMEKKWREQNAAIMAATPGQVPDWDNAGYAVPADEPSLAAPAKTEAPPQVSEKATESEPQLPLPPP
jgi:sec-independent protein translocase protein TatB